MKLPDLFLDRVLTMIIWSGAFTLVHLLAERFF